MALSTPSTTGSWRFQQPNSKESLGLIYERPLGLLELGFYYDSVFQGTADTLQHSEIGIDRIKAEDVFSYTNISRTWTNLKQQFPLLGARIEERDEDSTYFVVEAENLRQCRSEEITFQDITSAQEADDMMKRIIVKERLLTNDLLARIFILRRTDVVDVFHIFLHVAHSITDGMSNITILKTFFNQLCRQDSPTQTWNLTRQLALSEASENLYPQLKMSISKRRWRLAVAKILATKRMGKFAAGGHTIPRRVSQQTEFLPAASRLLNTALSVETSRLIISNCRKHNVTFGNAYPVIAQIATARLLLKRYLRGEISEEEWEFRKKEPMSSVGPLNLRPFLDKEWIEAGGFSHVCVSIGFFFYSLPMMPLGASARLRPGAEVPPFDAMLSKNRFLLRSRLIKKQSNNTFKHPLFLELGSVSRPARLAFHKRKAFQWRTERGPPKDFTAKTFSPLEEAARGPVFNNGGSSMGNIDLLLPREYPLGYEKDSTVPNLRLIKNTTMLHCRPTELYLGASTSQQQLQLIIHWDNNVFDEAVVTEWLEEVKNAVDFYLGQDEGPESKL
ncbi:hypothetical protein BJ912DRAFT_514561 [Pholiota molesta]|nr:hypothetical protein BJ912DRAFT_514561 [Pholiota molesta]